MIEGVKILEEVPVYDGFWMPLCYIVAGLCFIATALITAYCYKTNGGFVKVVNELRVINLLIQR